MTSLITLHRRGLTLIELLVVCFIMVLAVSMAIPTVRPALANRKIREASRQFNAFVAEAKAHAASRGRPVGIYIDRLSAVQEGSRDANFPFRMFLVEVPPPYRGDTLDATVQVGNAIPAANLPAGSPAIPILPLLNGSVSSTVRTLDFSHNLPSVAMLTPILDAYRREVGDFIAFGIRLNGSGNLYPAFAHYRGGASIVPYDFYIYCSYDTPLYSNVTGRMQGTIPFDIAFPPQKTNDSPLDLPEGIVIDLQFSGMGQSGDHFFKTPNTNYLAASRANPSPIIVMFSAGGGVSGLLVRNEWIPPSSRIHFLLGSAKKAIESVDTTNPASRLVPQSNLADPANIWISIQTQTGHVMGSDNLPPLAFTPDPDEFTNDQRIRTAIRQARDLATTLDSKGGR